MLLKNKKNLIYAIIFGFIFSFSNLIITIGGDYQNYGWNQFLLTFIISIVGSIVFGVLYLFIKGKLDSPIEKIILVVKTFCCYSFNSYLFLSFGFSCILSRNICF